MRRKETYWTSGFISWLIYADLTQRIFTSVCLAGLAFTLHLQSSSVDIYNAKTIWIYHHLLAVWLSLYLQHCLFGRFEAWILV